MRLPLVFFCVGFFGSQLLMWPMGLGIFAILAGTGYYTR